MKKRRTMLFALTLVLVASALICLVLAIHNGSLFGISRDANNAAGRELTALLEIIDEVYIGDYDSAEASAAAMRAVVDSLGDRWSYYLTPEEYTEYINSSNNRFAGIGIGVIIDEESGGMEVMYTYRDSPADAAGILAGDVIFEIDGINLSGMSLDEMRELLARPIGETADLMLKRADGTVEAVKVVYDLVFTDPISYRMLEDNIGYIKIANFEGGSADGFISAAGQLLEQGARALIFDVRSNGGGRVSEMTSMLDYLLPEGEIFISIDKSGKEEITMSDSAMVDIPAVVIVNSYSFSAAEYFAATLKEYDYAVIVGEQTTGKSRSQRTEPLPGGGALHISTAQYLTKNRVALYDVGGITPDYPLTLSDEEFAMFISGNLEPGDDPQIKLALDIIS